jgi:hypothetical protein
MRWAGAFIFVLVAGSGCGDDEPGTKASGAGGDVGAGETGNSAGTPGDSVGGSSGSAGSISTHEAGAQGAGAPPSGAAGAPVTGGGAGTGGAGDDGIVASGQAAPKGLALDAKNVYWASSGDGTIVSCPLTGCGGEEPTVVVDNAPGVRGIAVDGMNVYWMSDPNAGSMSSIKKCPLSGCPAQPIVLGDVNSQRPNDVHVLGTQLFYTAWPDFGLCTTSDCSPPARSLLLAAPMVSVDTDDQFIYYAQHGNEILGRCDRNDCTNATQLATGQRAISIAVDPTTLYFAKLAPLEHGMVDDPGIYSCPIDGCGDDEPAVVLTDVHAYAIALSATRLYYTDVDAGIVASIPK